jgi:hypothetical protein
MLAGCLVLAEGRRRGSPPGREHRLRGEDGGHRPRRQRRRRATGSALAFAEASSPRKPLRTMICYDFLLTEDAVKPEIV